MHILFVNEYCGFMGGVEQNMAHTARELRRRGHRLSLAYQRPTGNRVEEFQALYDECFVGLPDGPKLADSPVVYIHRIPSIEPWLNLARQYGLRTVRMVHDHDLTCPRRHKYYFHNQRACHQAAGWRCWLDLAFLEKSPHSGKFQLRSLNQFFGELRLHDQLDQILVASNSMLEELLSNQVPATRLTVLAPVVPVKAPSDQPQPQDLHNAGAAELLYVGQLVRGKGVDLLLRALAQVIGRRPGTRLRIIGQGNAKASLQLLAKKLGLEQSVEFSGFIAPEELDRAYADCRLLAVPSRWPEPFGMIGLEAAAHQKPVVAFAVGGIPDWLRHGHTGYLVADQDIAGFAATMLQLLEQPELAARLGRQAHSWINSNFQFSDYIDKLSDILRGAA